MKEGRRCKELLSGKIFNTIKEAALFCKTTPPHLSLSCKNASVIFKKYLFCYLDEEGNENMTREHVKKLALLKEVKSSNNKFPKVLPGLKIKAKRKVVCVEENKTFNTAFAAAQYYGLKSERVTNICSGYQKSTYLANGKRVRFEYLEEEKS